MRRGRGARLGTESELGPCRAVERAVEIEFGRAEEAWVQATCRIRGFELCEKGERLPAFSHTSNSTVLETRGGKDGVWA